jgi:hypothetical protein
MLLTMHFSILITNFKSFHIVVQFGSSLYFLRTKWSEIFSRILLKVGREILDAAARAIRPGITTDEIDAIVHKATIAAGKRSC